MFKQVVSKAIKDAPLEGAEAEKAVDKIWG